MKTKILHLVVAFCFLVLLPVKTVALNYTITFTGTGASSTVDSVIVQNLTKGTKVTVPAGNVLNLSDVSTVVDPLGANDETIRIYPTFVDGKSIVSFFSKLAGVTQLNAFSLDGRKVAGISADLQAGINKFELSLPRGVFVIQVTGNEYAYNAKLLNSTGIQGNPRIVYTGTEKPTSSSPQKNKSSTTGITTMTYADGNRLLYTSVSGNSSTIVTDVPTGSKTTNFNFVACTDADGNNYKVVTIGTQTWMAENLKTTLFNDGTAIPLVTDNAAWGYQIIPLTTPGYCWYNNDATTYKNKYGALYNWNTVKTGKLAPAGWHVPSEAEWTTLENYLISNGYNYDGSTSGNYVAKSLATNTDWDTESFFIGVIGNDLSKNNSTGFSALPSGCRGYGSVGIGEGSDCSWWSSSEGITDDGFVASFNSLLKNESYLCGSSCDLYYGYSVRCVRSIQSPFLTTSAISSIARTTATSGGNITDDGGVSITARGVCWSTSLNPTILDSKTNDGTGTGTFTSVLIGLSPNTNYNIRAYASNNAGTAYGPQITFTTSPNSEYTITDIDGNVYNTVTIGTQIWMIENLKTTKYNDGTSIQLETNNEIWDNLTTPVYCWYKNDPEIYKNMFGALYNWYSVNTGKLAPIGWHVATDAEWTTLGNYLTANGYNYDGSKSGDYYAKSLAANTNWGTDKGIGVIGNDLSKNNSSGFTALPSGCLANGLFGDDTSSGFWWSSTEYNTNSARCRYLYYNSSNLSQFSNYYKFYGLSVRCVKDEAPDTANYVARVLIPAGTFTMGSPTTELNRYSDETQYSVTLSAFRMSKYEITNAQYAAFLNAKGIGSNGIWASAPTYKTQTLIYASSGSNDWGLHYTNSKWIPVAGYETLPVIYVTWYGAAEFATFVGGSLPTEAQWEYACRAGTTTPFSTGTCLTNLQANYFWSSPYGTCTNTVTTPLNETQLGGSYVPNAFGLYDMHGNVCEWCTDWYGTYPTIAQTNPTGATTGSYRVFRGGSWYSSAQDCRSAFRNYSYPYNYGSNLGFRVFFVP